MYLCDIGNTNASVNHNGKMFSMPVDDFLNLNISEKVYYINVNDFAAKPLKKKKRFIDLEPYFDFDTSYVGMGIDRIAACYSVDSGMVIDAGSAITIDIMSSGAHLGGFILPGISASLNAYECISSRLKVDFKTNIDFENLPQSTQHAVTYGIIKPILLCIEENRKGKKVFFTGGDGVFLSRFFPNSIYKKGLIFDGMKKLMAENHLF